MSAGAAWERVARAALLGTERQPAEVDAATGDPALDAAVAAVADRPAEARLLGTAALLDAWRRAGRRASTAPALAEPAPEGDAPACSPLAARVLRQVLGDPRAPLLPEWLALARRAGVAIPHELLPEVLEYGRRHADARGAVASSLGPRGRWLAALNADWSYAAGVAADPAAGWETGTAEERIRILRHVRESDPTAGLALVQGTWATDAPKDRAAFLEALEIGLGMDDEPFLESVLDDRRKEVRAAAARLLSTLPGSRLVRRMIDRLDPLLRVQAPEGMLARLRQARPRIEVDLPPVADRAMQRDGIDAKVSHGSGERGWGLLQMLAAVPPSVWAARWGMDAAACLDAARAGEDADILVRGWSQAAVGHRDAEWAEALIRTQKGDDGHNDLAPLAATLPAERLEPLILQRLQGRLTTNDAAVRLLGAALFPWSPALTRAVLGTLPADFGSVQYLMREWLRGYALYMHPATAVATLREQGDPHEGPWVDLLHLRATLHQAFA